MTYRIAVSNISGGEGKTTIARELAFSLSVRGYKVALFDLDPQASLTKELGLHHSADAPACQPDASVTQVFRSETGTGLPTSTPVDGLDFWPSNEYLNEAESILMADFVKIENLRLAVDQLINQSAYDFVFFDCKPQRTGFLVASMAAADYIVMPISGLKGVENLDQMSKAMKAAKAYSPDLKISLFVPNRIRANTIHHQGLLAYLTELENIAPSSPPIRDLLAPMGAALEARQSVVQHAPRSELAKDFHAVANSLLSVLGVEPVLGVENEQN